MKRIICSILTFVLVLGASAGDRRLEKINSIITKLSLSFFIIIYPPDAEKALKQFHALPESLFLLVSLSFRVNSDFSFSALFDSEQKVESGKLKNVTD